MDKPYVLVKPNIKQDNKFVRSFKNSILGADIGIKSENFKIKFIIATFIALGTIVVMTNMFRI